MHIDGSIKEGKFIGYYINGNKVVAATVFGVFSGA